MKSKNATQLSSLISTCCEVLLWVCVLLVVWVVPVYYWDIVGPLLKELFVFFVKLISLITILAFMKETLNPSPISIVHGLK